MRVILDTNVWTYLAERGEQEAFEALEDRLGLTVVVPPSILLEALRTPLEEPRAKIVRAITSRGGTRRHPPPEARLEADEVVREARRVHREWLRQFPDTSRVRGLETFWTRKIWQAAARDPAGVAERAASTGMDGVADTILDIQEENKSAVMAAGFRPQDPQPWMDLDDQPSEVTAGWHGQQLEAWRVENSLLWWRELVIVPRRARRYGGDTTYADWTGAWLRLDVIARDRATWNRFWYEKVDPMSMPRNWIHAVILWTQLQTKVGAGNPRDAQHAAYLFDADFFFTADRRYSLTLDRLREGCPRPFAEVRLIPGHGSVVEAITTTLESEH